MSSIPIVTLVVALVLVSSGPIFGLAMLAYAKFPERRIRPEADRRLKGPKVALRMVAISVLSPALFLALTWLFEGRLVDEAARPAWRFVVDAVAVLLIYDLMYYCLHRFAFHNNGPLLRVHAVHHRARYPIAIDSLFQHPVEASLGIILLLLATWIVGPIHVYSFGAAFLVYSWLNIIVHSGVALPIPLWTWLARKHDAHHVDMKSGNYSSLIPLYDYLFGTAE